MNQVARFKRDPVYFAKQLLLFPQNVHRSYLASLVFGEDCRKIGVNTSGPESIN